MDAFWRGVVRGGAKGLVFSSPALLVLALFGDNALLGVLAAVSAVVGFGILVLEDTP